MTSDVRHSYLVKKIVSNKDKSENPTQLEHIKNELEDTKTKAQQLNNIGSDIKKQGAFIWDLANCGLQALSDLPPSNNYHELSTSVERLKNSLDNYLSSFATIQPAQATGMMFAGTATLNSFNSVFLDIQTPVSPPYMQPTNHSWQSFEELSHHPSFRDEALRHIERLGIANTDSGNRAVKQLNAAWNSHLQLPNSPTESLITMRETIEMVLDELVRRRPLQRPVLKKEKIVEIGTQCGAVYAIQSDFRKLEDEWHLLKDDLSKEKRPTADRQAEMALMRKATWLLTKFLTAIDPAKLK